MKVLIVNDDGIAGLGLKILATKLKEYYDDILIVAPSTEKSAISHAITLRRGITVTKCPDLVAGIPTYTIDANPADCVKIAKLALKYDFDLVFSGINNGLNLANDIMYSGTVAGASEAAFFHKTGIAISCAYNSLEDFACFDNFWPELTKLPIFANAAILNINIPNNPKGMLITKQGENPFEPGYRVEDGKYIANRMVRDITLTNLANDIDAYNQGYISVTPLTINRTDTVIYNQYKK